MKSTRFPLTTLGPSLALACLLGGLTQAQLADDGTTRKPPPLPGTYYSAQRPTYPPLPWNPFPDLPLYSWGERRFIYDDREVDYSLLKSETAESAAPLVPTVDHSALLTSMGDCASELLIFRGSNAVTLLVTNATAGKTYDLLTTGYLLGDSITNSFWRWLAKATNGQWFTFSTQPCREKYFVLGCDTDSDNDDLTDAYEVLVTKTSPTTNHSVNAFFTDKEMENILVNDPDQDCGNEQNTQDETAVIALGNTVVAAWVDSNLGVPGYGVPDPACPDWSDDTPPRFIGWAVSTNGGLTFDDKGAPPMSTNGSNIFGATAGDPVLGYDVQSNVVYLVGNPKRYSVYSINGTNQHYVPVWRSTDGGQTFGSPLNVTPGLLAAATTEMADKPAIAVDNFPGPGQGNAYVAIYLGSRIYVYRSIDHGSSWQALTNVGYPAFGAQLAVGPNHHIYLAWRELLSDAPRFAFAKSADFGTNFVVNSSHIIIPNAPTSDLRLTRFRNSDPADYFRTPVLPVLAANPAITNHLYLVYNDRPTNATDRADIYLAQSIDGGATWTNFCRVNSDATTNDQWQPAIAVKPDGSQLFVAWYDRRNDPASNSLIQTYGVFAGLPLVGTNSLAANFLISSVQFPPAFTGTAMTNAGTFDPAYPPRYRNDGVTCPNFYGYYAPHMGDYDIPFADNTYIYYTWADNRITSFNRGGVRHQADIRLVTVPWPQ